MTIGKATESHHHLRFRDGYLLQLFTPKGLAVILPVTVLMLPATGVSATGVVLASAVISLDAVAAPGVYALAAHLLLARRRRMSR